MSCSARSESSTTPKARILVLLQALKATNSIPDQVATDSSAEQMTHEVIPVSAEIFGARILQFVNHIQVLMASSSNDTVEVCSACAALIEPTNPPSIGISLEKALDTIRNVLNIRKARRKHLRRWMTSFNSWAAL